MTPRIKTAATAKTIIRPTLGFGVPATSDPHHFIIEIPRNNTGAVSIVENLGLQSHDHSQSQIARCLLERPRWTAIRSEAQRAFNIRLKERQLKTSAWVVGINPVDRLLGKELCVLAWAVEGMAFDHIPIAVRNWLALRPEERWWLFSQTAAEAGWSIPPPRRRRGRAHLSCIRRAVSHGHDVGHGAGMRSRDHPGTSPDHVAARVPARLVQRLRRRLPALPGAR